MLNDFVKYSSPFCRFRQYLSHVAKLFATEKVRINLHTIRTLGCVLPTLASKSAIYGITRGVICEKNGNGRASSIKYYVIMIFFMARLNCSELLCSLSISGINYETFCRYFGFWPGLCGQVCANLGLGNSCQFPVRIRPVPWCPGQTPPRSWLLPWIRFSMMLMANSLMTWMLWRSQSFVMAKHQSRLIPPD